MTKINATAIAAVLLGLLAQQGAQAALVTSNAAFGTVQLIDFNDFDGLLSSGPVALGAGVSLNAGPDVEIGAKQRDLGENGLWGARGNPVDGLVDTPTGNGNFLAGNAAGTLAFSFGAPVAGVGAYLNQFQQDGVANSFTRLAYGANGTVLESHAYSVETGWDGYNEGQFLGIQRASADIYGFGINGEGMVLDNLSLTMTTAVPEPQSYAMLLAGLGTVGWLLRRRRAA